MRVDIGDVELPILSQVEELRDGEVQEIKDGFKKLDSVAVQHDAKVETLALTGFLNEEMHSSDKTIAQQKKDFKSLRTSDVTDNSINFLDYQGHLLIEDVNFTDNADSVIVDEVEITARYFQWPKYYSDEPEP